MSIICPNCDNENYVLGYVCTCGHHEEVRTNSGFSVFEIPMEELQTA